MTGPGIGIVCALFILACAMTGSLSRKVDRLTERLEQLQQALDALKNGKADQ